MGTGARRAARSFWLGAAALVMGVCAAHAEVRYHLTNLGQSFYVADVNASGVVVGDRSFYGGHMACCWDRFTGLTDLGYLPGGDSWSEATGINDSGLIVGNSNGGNGAFVWEESLGMMSLPTLNGEPGADANAISHSAYIVGASGSDNGWRACRWNQDGSMVDLGDLPGGSSYSVASDVNERGLAVGYSSIETGRHAFLYDPSYSHPDAPTCHLRDLGDFDGGDDQSRAHGINDLDHVCGGGTISTGGRAFLWAEATGMRDLGDLPGGAPWSAAFGVNNWDQVVGLSYVGVDLPHAFLWEPRLGMQDLNDLIDPASGWTLKTAEAINNQGMIVGRGHGPGSVNDQAYLLTPVELEEMPGDINGDDRIDLFDAFLFNAAWGTQAGDSLFNRRCDLNFDGRISIFDAFQFNQHWVDSAQAPTAVPEPATAILLTGGLFALAARRRVPTQRRRAGG